MATGSCKPQLGYYDNRTIAEPLRLLLALGGIEYDDKRYPVGEPPSYDKEEWQSGKFTLGLAAPNLPFWIEPGRQGLRLTQSRAIMMHIADRCGLAGETPRRRSQVHMAVEAISDLFEAFLKVTYCNSDVARAEPGVHVAGESQARATSPLFERRRYDYLAHELPPHLAHMGRLLLTMGDAETGDGRATGWLVGAPSPTCADVFLFECLDQHLIFAPRCLDGGDDADGAFAALRAHHARVLALPAIAEYRASAKFVAEPLHNRYSHFHRGWIPPNDWARSGTLAQPAPTLDAGAATPPRPARGAGLLPAETTTTPAGAVFVFEAGRPPLDAATRAAHERTKRRRMWRDLAVFVGFGACIAILVVIGRNVLEYDPETAAETELHT